CYHLALCPFPTRRSSDLPSFKNPSSSDTDFCGYYNKGVNPDYYVIRVCPYCGFSFSENSFTRGLTENQKKLYYKEIGNHWTSQRSEEHTSELQSRENLVC